MHTAARPRSAPPLTRMLRSHLCRGTSYATPLVSAAAAMVWQAALAAGRSVAYSQVKVALLGSVDVYPSLQNKVTT